MFLIFVSMETCVELTWILTFRALRHSEGLYDMTQRIAAASFLLYVRSHHKQLNSEYIGEYFENFLVAYFSSQLQYET